MNGIKELPWFRLEQPTPAEEVERARQWILSLRAAPLSWAPIGPFCVITPLGMKQREKIRHLFSRQNIAVEREVRLDDWPPASTLIYAKTLDDERLRVALLFEALWREVAPAQPAELWLLAGDADHNRLMAGKRQMRQALETLRFRVSLPGIVLHSPGQVVRLHPFHVPDAERLADEALVLSRYLGMTSQAKC